MQITKAHARYLRGQGGPLWHITHGQTSAAVWATLPRDGAALLIERYVLTAQVEKLVEIDRARRALAEI
ncbi:hypothetical protein [Caballeronia sp. LZ032]|uniref:hypothetical protein n=1 Tax=Caballeronia sp. LZ032 TaxID=3038565 RepID=UPI002855B535|nr:hypothetical protein [Caballeronia sp. LZ032]MDR5883589.1 hypothetical protein [Caballeronia sp. LZ032]